MSSNRTRRLVALTAGAALAVTAIATAAPGTARPRPQAAGHHGAKADVSKDAVARGSGGAVSSVDPNASAIGVEVLRRGGNAVDAAVATASALGVTEPFSAGVGGGGYLVYYDARSGKVRTLDGRETAPAAMTHDAFIDPATGQPYPFTPERVTSGVSVGVPGTLATWDQALDRWGTLSLRKALRPSVKLARQGFTVDDTFRGQILDNADRFSAFPDTAALYLPGGDAPRVGSRFRNRDLAATLQMIGKRGPDVFYRGRLAREIARTVQSPPTGDTDLPVPPGSMTRADLADYEVYQQRPTKVRYKGLDVYGMAPSSSGGTTVGEALNILEDFNLARSTTRSLHLYLEASALAFADRGAYLGDARYVDVPTRKLLSQRFADSRACLIDDEQAAEKPVAAGSVDDLGCAARAKAASAPDTEGLSTTNISVVDRWGNAVAYTLTIEQTGGSGMLVPDRGFLLNNELTDFSAVYDPADPNRIDGGKRPRSSMSPTIVADGRGARIVLGSPGGSTIITTVLQTLVNRLDLGMNLPKALAAPRASQRNTATVTAEPEFIERYGDALTDYGHTLVPSGDAFTSAAEIGAATAIEIRPNGSLVAAAEPVRRGGGDAEVVCDGDRRCRR